MKLGVTGTRDGFSFEQKEKAGMWLANLPEPVTEFHYGDCTGVDESMLWMVLDQGYTPHLHIYPGLVSDKWRAKTFNRLTEIGYAGGITQYEPLPPKVRNGHIAANCDQLWAFPGSGGGTWDCVRKAQALNRFGFIVYRDGEVKSL
jgi:hypothetical protein